MGVSLFSPNQVRARNERLVADVKLSAWLELYRAAVLANDTGARDRASEAIRKLKAGEDV